MKKKTLRKRLKALRRASLKTRDLMDVVYACHDQEEAYHAQIANSIEQLRQILMDPIWSRDEGKIFRGVTTAIKDACGVVKPRE